MGRIHLVPILIFLAVILLGVSAHFIIKSYRESLENVARSEKSQLTKVVIDTDAGGDDAAAILLVLQAERNASNSHKTIAITCTYGNTNRENVEINVLKTLTVANRSDIPVYGGADQPLLLPYQKATFFGDDGFGDFEFNEPILGHINRSCHAANALINLSKEYPGEITVLAIGPLTNIALAERLDPGFLRRLKGLVILGGSVNGVGNKGPGVEFNFYQDPESNFVTFNSTGNKPSILVPWETIKASNNTKEWRENVFSRLNSRITRFLDKAERVSLEKSSDWDPSDAIAAAIMMWPDLVKRTTTTNITPVVDGSARATLLVDYSNKTQKPVNTVIIQDFDSPRFLTLLLTLFS